MNCTKDTRHRLCGRESDRYERAMVVTGVLVDEIQVSCDLVLACDLDPVQRPSPFCQVSDCEDSPDATGIPVLCAPVHKSSFLTHHRKCYQYTISQLASRRRTDGRRYQFSESLTRHTSGVMV